MDKEFHGKYDIWGGDINPRAIAIAKDNARKAGVDDIVRFDVADASKLRVSGDYGQIVTNPPYGERLLEKQEAEALYRVFGETYRHIPPKWRVLVLTSHPEFEKFFNRKADKKRKLYNGMIKCDLYFFQRG
jgi:putative N6-adenine-specific DNA methylase